MPKHGQHRALVVSVNGNAITRNPARIEFAADAMRTMTYGKVRKAIMERWGVCKATAERDIAIARQLIAQELNGMETRAAEARRNERIADKAEALAAKAAQFKDWASVAAFQRNAIHASRELSRLTGAYAPRQLEVTHHAAAADMPLRLDAILGVLSDRGRAALDVVLEEIDAAKQDGRLAPTQDGDVEDAEIVEPGESGPAVPNGESN